MTLSAPEKVFGAMLPFTSNSTINKFFLALLMSVCFVLSGTAQTPIPNPDLATDQACDQFRVIVVLDESGSIDDGPNGSANEQSVRDAAVALATGLSNSGAQLAVVEFSSSASVSSIGGVSGFQTVDDSYVTQLDNYLDNNYSPGGCTNWGEAFDRVIGLNNSNLAQLVVFVTDGVPTIESDGFNSCGLFCTGFCQEALNVAVNRSNQVKNQGSHIFVLGVGEAQNNAAEIQAISGPDQDTAAGVNPPSDPGFAQADYSLVPFSMLQPCLEDIVNQSCSQVVNPDLEPLPCDEFDVMIILDESGSIDDGPNGNTNEQSMRDAAVALANSLSGSGANMSVVKFSTDAEIVNIPGFDPNWNPVGPSYTAALQSYLNSNYNAEGWTNWEDAFQKAIDLNAIRTADLIIFATDGNPTAYVNNGGGCVDCDESIGNICTDCEADNALDRATPNSDILKAAGSHLFGLAIGTGINLANISAVTGLDQDIAPGDAPGPDPGFNQADYSALPFSDLIVCIGDIAAQSCDPCQANVDFINFDTDADGNPLAAGTDPSNSWSSFGITITTSDPTNNPPMIFDTSNPTGSDTDLGSPNETAPVPGPGQGTGGEIGALGENLEALGNVLIISQDGDASDPNDNASGGSVFFNFNTPTDVTGVKILDTDFSEIGGLVIAKANDNSIIKQQEILAYGSNSVQTVLLNADDVSQLEVQFPSSGSVAQLILCTDETELASVGDLVYVDDDCDPINGNTQTGIANVTVRLLDVDDNVIAETTTGPNGMYLFDNLIPGIYQVQIAGGIPAMYTAIADLDGDNDGSSGPFVLLPLQERTDVDFGYLSTEGCCELEIECPDEDGGSYQCLADVPQPNPNSITIIDSCDTPVISVMEEMDGEGCPGDPLIVKYTYTVTDGAESETCEVSYTVMDTMDPVITCPAEYTADCDGGSTDPSAAGFATAMDNCDANVHVDYSDGPQSSDCPASFTRTWTATDDCGNTASCTQLIIIDDTDEPIITCPADASYQCLSEVPAVDLGQVSAIDNCSDPVITFEGESITGDECSGTITRTFRATDPCGNYAECTQTITYQDTTDPVITCPAAYTADCDGGSTDPSAAGFATALDNCDANVHVDYSDGPQSTDCPASFTRTWTATDNCGNTASCTQLIIIDDTDEPIITCPADASYQCLSEVPAVDLGQVSAIDNCSDPVITFEGESITGDECSGTITRTFRATDPCGNYAECTQTITYQDTMDPVITCPAEYTADCDGGSTDPSAAGFATAMDNCDANVHVDYSDGPQSTDCPASFTRTWTATDDCGNTASCTQLIIIDDTDEPIITCPADASYQCLSEVPDVDLGQVSAIDNCSDPVITFEGESITGDECSGTITRTFRATDPCGNYAECTQTITYQDTTDPVLHGLPQDDEIDCQEMPEAPAMVTASDNCLMDIDVMFTEVFDDSECPKRYLRTWTATDNCGNVASHTQTIYVIDNEAPVIDPFPIQVNVECDELEDLMVTASDNCSDVTITYEDLHQSGGCLGMIIRTWIATDDCGNRSEAEQYIGLKDTTPPTIFGVGADMTIDCESPIPAIPMVTATDNCEMDVDLVFNQEIIQGNCPSNYQIVWTWTATDFCDNVTEETQTITVEDTTAPAFLEVPVNLVLECDEVIPAPQTPLVQDNCSTYEVMYNEVTENGICPQSFVKYRTWTATDACGNQSSYTQEIVVQDTTDPVIGDLDDITIQCDEALPTNLPSATDNCGVATVTELQEIIPTDCASEYTLIRTFTATDECGNTSESEQVVTVQDTEGPTLSDYPTDMVLDCEDDIPNPPVITASDNCDADVQVTFEQTFIGEAPDPEAENDCVLLTPATENYDEDWGLILPGFEQGYVFYTVVGGRWRDYADGSARIEATFVSIDNDNAGWVADIYLENGLNWDDWSTQDFPTSFKDDFDEAGDEYLNWIYYIIRSEGSVLEGWGDFEGSSLSIEHAPANFYYGYQVGIAANNVNSEFGSGGWFTYDGLFVDASTDFSAQVNGGGDFAFNHDCCPQYEVVWTWTATDCAGNVETHSLNISFQDLGGTEDVEVRCATDFDGDGTTNSRDLLMFLGDFGCQENCGCDLNGDDRVDAADLLAFLGAFGEDCE